MSKDEPTQPLLPVTPFDQALVEKALQDYIDGTSDKTLAETAQSIVRSISNPCAKIFDHKWLDPECVETGCQSLVWKSRYEAAVKGRQEFRQALRDERAAALTPSALSADVTNGWIVGNGDGTKWRVWTQLGPDWTDEREKATRYARRVDAEQVHAADDDAWRVEPFVAAGPQCERPPEGWACTRGAGHDGPCAAIPSALSGDAGEGE